MKQEDIYIVFKREQGLDLNFLKRFIENFKTANIVTNDIERLKNVQDNLLENDGILIAVSNNKKKALKQQHKQRQRGKELEEATFIGIND